MILRKLKIVDEKMNVDGLYLFFYLSLFGSVVSFSVAHSTFLWLVTLAISIMIIWRDDLIRKKKDPIEELSERLTDLQGELTAVRIAQGLSRE